MSKFTAVILWPVVYVLDVLSWLFRFQTFKEARDLSNILFKRIMARNTKVFERGGNVGSSISADN
ncbi:hypothetical protein [Mucilaginibacter sp.]